MRKHTKVYHHGDGRFGTKFVIFPTWGWDKDGNKVWRWLEQVSYNQKYVSTLDKSGWGRYTWTDL